MKDFYMFKQGDWVTYVGETEFLRGMIGVVSSTTNIRDVPVELNYAMEVVFENKFPATVMATEVEPV